MSKFVLRNINTATYCNILRNMLKKIKHKKWNILPLMVMYLLKELNACCLIFGEASMENPPPPRLRIFQYNSNHIK